MPLGRFVNLLAKRKFQVFDGRQNLIADPFNQLWVAFELAWINVADLLKDTVNLPRDLSRFGIAWLAKSTAKLA